MHFYNDILEAISTSWNLFFNFLETYFVTSFVNFPFVTLIVATLGHNKLNFLWEKHSVYWHVFSLLGTTEDYAEFLFFFFFFFFWITVKNVYQFLLWLTYNYKMVGWTINCFFFCNFVIRLWGVGPQWFSFSLHSQFE